MTSTLDVQKALKGAGFDPGPLDGLPGRKTASALRAYQAAKLIPVTGLVDVATVAKLFGSNPARIEAVKTADPVWLAEARRFMGLREVAGKGSNPTILGFTVGLPAWVKTFFADDDIAWCGLFVAHCISSTLPTEPLPTNPLSALAWAKFGRKLEAPALGAIMVFERKGGGHVAEYVGEDADAYHVIGGNQSNSVSVTRIAKSRCVAIRWPSTAPLPASGRIVLNPNGSLSKNEA